MVVTMEVMRWNSRPGLCTVPSLSVFRPCHLAGSLPYRSLICVFDTPRASPTANPSPFPVAVDLRFQLLVQVQGPFSETHAVCLHELLQGQRTRPVPRRSRFLVRPR
jgi:hypothetical protein